MLQDRSVPKPDDQEPTGAIPKHFNVSAPPFQFASSDRIEQPSARNETVNSVRYPEVVGDPPKTTPIGWPPCSSSSSPTTPSNGLNSPSLLPQRHSLFRRPKIDIEQFNGDPHSWPRFIASFNDMIQADPALSQNDKLRLLKSCLSDRIRDSLGMLLENSRALWQSSGRTIVNLRQSTCSFHEQYFQGSENCRELTTFSIFPRFMASRPL